MKINLVLRILSTLLTMQLFPFISFSQFENTIGSITGSDETTDVKPLPNGRHTAVLANTTSFGPQKILLMELDPAGHVLFSKTIYDSNNPDIEFEGSSLELDFDNAGNHIGYFITGSKGSLADPPKMILIRTDLNGVPTWSRQMNGLSDPITNIAIGESGVSLERQSNNDIIVIGKSNSYKFSVSRFTQTGTLIWSHRYGTDGFLYIPIESCNGKRGGQEVVAVTGLVHESGFGHSFLSCIKASNGVEFWRQRYNSGHYYDEFTDVVQNPEDEQFMAIGRTKAFDTPASMWVCNANSNNGALTNGATYNLLPPYYDLWARDVCLSPDKVTATITGYLNYDSPDGSFESRTYIMNIPFGPIAFPHFSHYFSNSNPLTYKLFLAGDEAIESITGADPGYILGTQSKLMGSAAFDYDIHVLRLNLLGQTNSIDCPIIPFFPHFREEGFSRRLNKEKEKSLWSSLSLIASNQSFVEEDCNVITLPPNNQLMKINTSHIPNSDIFPNPAIAGSIVNFHIELKDPGTLEFQIMDLTGRIYGQWHEYKKEGSQLIEIKLPSSLGEGMYLIKVQFPADRLKLFKLMVRPG